MDDRLRAIEARHRVFLRRELADLGYDNRAVRTALKLRILHRVRHGAYCFYDTWANADEVARHRIRSGAVVKVLGGKVALSHVSALLEHGVDVWGIDLSRVHVTRLDGGAGRVQRDVVHHEGVVAERDLVEREGRLLIEPTRAVLETGTLSSVESGLVIADSALHKGLTDPDALDRVFRWMRHWPGSQKLHLVTRMADGRAESVGESRSRHLFWSEGLPQPNLQVPIYDGDVLVAVTDFGWPDLGLLGEFDGKVKYGRLLPPGRTPGDAVFDEKRREDRIRELTGFTLFRLVWADLSQPQETAYRFRRLSRGHAA